MSGDAKSIVLGIFERWNEGERDFDPALSEPGIEIHSAMTSQHFSGIDGLHAWIEEIDLQFSSWRLDAESVEEPEPGTIVASGHIRGEGRASGVAFDQPASWVIELPEGRVRALYTFLDQESAARHFQETRA